MIGTTEHGGGALPQYLVAVQLNAPPPLLPDARIVSRPVRPATPVRRTSMLPSAVVTALFIAVLPVALYFLEIILTFAQALIFSVLSLMFTLIAIESHHHEEGEMAEEAIEAIHDTTHLQPHEAAAA